MARPLKLVALPRDPNPYQELLYGALRRRGAAVRYGACLTPSHTLNLSLLPAELALRRAAGFRVLHLHWVFGFSLPGSGTSRFVKRLSRWWFTLILSWARLLGFRIAWTAHNVLPHAPVFDDDAQARRALVRRCAVVMAHNTAAIAGLAALGARPAASCVIPLGPMAPAGRFDGLPEPGGGAERTVLFFGVIAPYKGVDELLRAAREPPDGLRVIVAGECADPALRETLTQLAGRAGPHVELDFGYVDDDDLEALFVRADAFVFPFRAVTTSSSVLLAMAAGRPAVIPDLPGLADLSAETVLRYPPGAVGLRRALAEFVALPLPVVRAMGSAARESTFALSWDEVAANTETCLRGALNRPRPRQRVNAAGRSGEV